MGAAQNKAVNAVAFSPDGTRLASGIGKYGISYSETVKVWVPAAGKVAQTLRHQNDELTKKVAALEAELAARTR